MLHLIFHQLLSYFYVWGAYCTPQCAPSAPFAMDGHTACSACTIPAHPQPCTFLIAAARFLLTFATANRRNLCIIFALVDQMCFTQFVECLHAGYAGWESLNLRMEVSFRVWWQESDERQRGCRRLWRNYTIGRWNASRIAFLADEMVWSLLWVAPKTNKRGERRITPT